MTNSFVIENQKRRSGKNTLNIHYGRACGCAWHYSAFSRWLVGKIKLNVQIAGNKDIALNATDLWKSLSHIFCWYRKSKTRMVIGILVNIYIFASCTGSCLAVIYTFYSSLLFISICFEINCNKFNLKFRTMSSVCLPCTSLLLWNVGMCNWY